MSIHSEVKLGQIVIVNYDENQYLTKGNRYIVMNKDDGNIAVINNNGDEWWLNDDYTATQTFAKLPKVGYMMTIKKYVNSYVDIGRRYECIEVGTNGMIWAFFDNDGDKTWVTLEQIEVSLEEVPNDGRPRPFRPIGKSNFRTKREDYRCIFEKAGFQRLGSGHFSIVYGKPNSADVFKVGKLGDGWLAYAKLVMTKHRDNPFAPKIKYIKWFGEGDNRWWIAKMERLKAFNYGEGEKEFMLSSSLLNGNYAKSAEAREAYVKARRKHPLLLALIEDIRENVLPKYDLDFHSENAMLRGTTLVITDPAAYPKDKKLRERFRR